MTSWDQPQICRENVTSLTHSLHVYSSVSYAEQQGQFNPQSFMLGTFQQSSLRIEINASEQKIRDSLLCPVQFRQWLFPQTFSAGLPEQLYKGLVFTGWLGPVSIQHHVDAADDHGLRLLLSQGIDGYHEWHWGEGWVQSTLEGVSILPLNLGQTLSLLRLRTFLVKQA